MDSISERQLSKLMSYILRHNPGEFDLELDSEGFVSLEDFISAIRKRRQWRDSGETEIRQVINGSGRQRFEIKDGMIRATYGHTVENAPVYPVIEPPEILFHGTARALVAQLREEGLRPMDRQYVHLSPTEDIAREVGSRHDDEPAILRVNASLAASNGIKFHRPIDEIILVREIPARYIEFPGTEENE